MQSKLIARLGETQIPIVAIPPRTSSPCNPPPHRLVLRRVDGTHVVDILSPEARVNQAGPCLLHCERLARAIHGGLVGYWPPLHRRRKKLPGAGGEVEVGILGELGEALWQIITIISNRSGGRVLGGVRVIAIHTATGLIRMGRKADVRSHEQVGNAIDLNIQQASTRHFVSHIRPTCSSSSAGSM
jgi:hypothetical protein